MNVDPTLWNTSGDRSKAWTPQAAYDVKRGSTRVGTYTASASGSIGFSHAPGSTSVVTYSVTPH